MFRKLISNLAFSPALVGQIGFYAKRLRKEEATRRIGLIFTVLALVIQSLAVFVPPEAANASNPSNFIKGGVTSIDDYLKHYDQNTNNIKDLFDQLGITKANIAAAKPSTVNSKDIPSSWGLSSTFSAAQGDKEYTIRTSNGGLRTFHHHSLALWDSLTYTKKYGSTYDVYQGVSSTGQWFALSKVCGNLLLKTNPPAPKCPAGMVGQYPACTKPPTMCTYPGKTGLLASDKECKPTPKCTIPGKTNLDSTDANCKPDAVAACTNLKITKLVNNYELTANSTVAHGATVTSYTYVIKKDGKVVKTITNSSNKLSDTAFTKQTAQGKYTVELTVKTSLGDKTSPDCVKTFSIPPPAMCTFNPKILASSPECQPCPGDSNIWIKDEKCSAQVVYTKASANITQGDVDATKTTARAGDKIVYTLNLNNDGKAPITVTPVDNLTDVAEYATVIDTGGGTYDTQTKTLTWPSVTLQPGAKQSRIFTVKVVDSIPAMGMGVSNKTSYDCRIDNTFGNMTSINVNCPIQKQFVEQTVGELPHTGPRENMLFGGIVLSIVSYFYMRSRQMKKEVRLIRRDLNAGTI